MHIYLSMYAHTVYQVYKYQSGPENPSKNFVLLYKNTQTFLGTDLFASFQFGRVGFTIAVVCCAAMGGMAGMTARAKCRQHIRHVWTASIAQAFVFELGENRFELGELYTKRYSHTPTTHMAPQ